MKSKVGIIGATGFTGVELIRLLLNHSKVEIVGISSTNSLNVKISDLYPAFYGIFDMVLEDNQSVVDKSDIIFLALPHGQGESIAKQCVQQNKLCIDLSADFRLEDEQDYKNWYGKEFEDKDVHEKAVYALPELFYDEIKNSKLLANPGCYPTSIALGLYPLIKENAIDAKNIIIDSKSGATGAGKSPSTTTHFTTLNESFKPYGIFTHRHTPEINQTLSKASQDNVSVIFTPHLLPINRGIISTMYTKVNDGFDETKIRNIFDDFYNDKYFVRIKKQGDTSNLKDVKYTNFCDISIHFDEKSKTLIIVSCIDNMVKGASGQAIQNMNICKGFDEKEGLDFVSTSF